MDLVMATSRGKGLSEEFDLLPENPLINPIFSIHPGRSLAFLTDKAIEIITNSPYPTHTIHVYFIAGLIDLSEKITDIHYKEFICNDSYIDIYHKMQKHTRQHTNKNPQHRRHPLLCHHHSHAHRHLESPLPPYKSHQLPSPLQTLRLNARKPHRSHSPHKPILDSAKFTTQYEHPQIRSIHPVQTRNHKTNIQI